MNDIFDVLRLKTSFSGYIFNFKMEKISASGGKINYKKPPLVDRPAPNKGGFLIKGGGFLIINMVQNFRAPAAREVQNIVLYHVYIAVFFLIDLKVVTLRLRFVIFTCCALGTLTFLFFKVM